MLKTWYFVSIALWPISLSIVGLQLNLSTFFLLTLFTVLYTFNALKLTVSLTKLAYLFTFLAFSILVAYFGPCTTGHLKQLFSIPLVSLLLFYGYNLGKNSTSYQWIELEKVALYVLFFMFFTFIGEYFFPTIFSSQFSEGYRIEGRYTAFYSEPSYVAFSAFPSILILTTSERKFYRNMGICASVGLYLFSRSSTLVILTAAYVVFHLLSKKSTNKAIKFILLTVCFVSAIIFLIPSQITQPFTDRFFGVLYGDADSNLSSLVYLQGWQDAITNIQRTYGLGLGFNMMGCHPLPDVWARYFLTSRISEDLNASDGSFLFSKIISEFGILGLIFCCLILFYFLRSMAHLKVTSKSPHRRSLEIQLIIAFAFISPLLVRGTGYFNGIVILFFISVPTLFKKTIVIQR